MTKKESQKRRKHPVSLEFFWASNYSKDRQEVRFLEANKVVRFFVCFYVVPFRVKYVTMFNDTFDTLSRVSSGKTDLVC